MSIDRILKEYYSSINGHKNGDNKDYATRIVSEALRNEWSEAQLLHAIKNRHPRAMSLKDILFSKENLLAPNQMYYHSELRILPPLPKSRIDEVTGEIYYLNLHEDWSLETVRVYGIYNLLKYYYGLFKMTPNFHEVKRDTGAFKYLLNICPIDPLLFTVDVTHGYMIDLDRPAPSSPFELQDYFREGLATYEEKVAYDKVVGAIGSKQERL